MIARETKWVAVEFGGGDLVERVTDIYFTAHSLKKAMKRFGFTTTEEAAEWLSDCLDEAVKIRPTRDGGTAYITPEGIEVIAQVRTGSILVVTVYEKRTQQQEMKSRRRRQFRQRGLREVG